MAREYSMITKNIPQRNDTKTGNAPDSYGTALAFDAVCHSVDVFVFDNAALVKRTWDGTNYDDEFEIPADSVFSFDAKTHSINIKNKTSGSTARYSIIGWY